MSLIFHNLLRNYFDHVHCFPRFLLTLLFTQPDSKALFVLSIEYIFLNLDIQAKLATFCFSSIKPTAIPSTLLSRLFSSCYANSQFKALTNQFIICRQTKNDINNLIQSIQCNQTIHSFYTKSIIQIRLFHLFDKPNHNLWNN